jgi:hypothetical protein
MGWATAHKTPHWPPSKVLIFCAGALLSVAQTSCTLFGGVLQSMLIHTSIKRCYKTILRQKGPGKHVHVFFKLANDQNVLERDENAATCFQNQKPCFQNILAPGESNLERGENATRCVQNKKPYFQNILVPGWIILVRDQNKHVHVFRLHFAGEK